MQQTWPNELLQEVTQKHLQAARRDGSALLFTFYLQNRISPMRGFLCWYDVIFFSSSVVPSFRSFSTVLSMDS